MANQNSWDFDQREAFKGQAYKSEGPQWTHELFEKITLAWWHRQTVKVGLDDYRRHVARACLMAGEKLPSEVLKDWPPATGTVKIMPGGSDIHKRGIPAGQNYGFAGSM